MRSATDDLCWLLDRGYAVRSSLQLVGNRYQLRERQRLAVWRCADRSEAIRARRDRQVAVAELAGACVWLDGYNVLTSIEAALGGGVLLAARDGCIRDMASMHGSYRKVAETIPALRLIGAVLAEHGAAECRWLLDSPVSNSGRLKGMLLETAAAEGWQWTAEVVPDPDRVLGETDELVATSDSVILDRCPRWVNLVREVVTSRIPGAWIVDLGEAG